MYKFLESRVIDTEDETYVEVTELRMADLWVEKSTSLSPRIDCNASRKRFLADLWVEKPTSLSPRIVMEVEKDFSTQPETVL